MTRLNAGHQISFDIPINSRRFHQNNPKITKGIRLPWPSSLKGAL